MIINVTKLFVGRTIFLFALIFFYTTTHEEFGNTGWPRVQAKHRTKARHMQLRKTTPSLSSIQTRINDLYKGKRKEEKLKRATPPEQV